MNRHSFLSSFIQHLFGTYACQVPATSSFVFLQIGYDYSLLWLFTEFVYVGGGAFVSMGIGAFVSGCIFSALVQYLLNDQLINVSGFGLETLILWWMGLDSFL